MLQTKIQLPAESTDLSEDNIFRLFQDYKMGTFHTEAVSAVPITKIVFRREQQLLR